MEETYSLAELLTAAGGLGVFLVGMVTMTDALRALAGERMRSFLLRYTRTPATGAMAGAACTAAVQSSSATTVAAVGFVGAELMSFSSGLSIIFGANLGTTITGWMVALIGFKLQLGTATLPLILLGAVMRLFGRRPFATWGMAIAGFGLIFVGLEFMQSGFGALQHVISFEGLPGDTILGIFVLVLFGLVFTMITQSSSAGVAATLSALFAGVIEFEQAAAIVVGMDVGTSFTALIASIGGSVGARRTGLSHVIFNVCTAMGAVFLIAPYVWAWEKIAPGLLVQEAELALVGFHTIFNALSVIIVVPLTPRFARLITRLVPDPTSRFVDRLDPMLLSQPTLALSEVQIVTKSVFLALLDHVRILLGESRQTSLSLADLDSTLGQTVAFVDLIELDDNQDGDWAQLVATIHILDHLQRLHERCDEDAYRAHAAAAAPGLREQCEALRECAQRIADLIAEGDWEQAADDAKAIAADISQSREFERNEVVKEVGMDSIDTAEGTLQMRAIRWLVRVSTHLEHVTRHMRRFA